MKTIFSIVCCLIIIFNGIISAQVPQLIWSDTYNSPFNKDDIATGCAADHLGNLYVTGSIENSNQSNVHDILTIKYNALTGDTIWTSRYNSTMNFDDEPGGCAVDKDGNLFVTGYTAKTGSEEGDDLILIKYDPADGNPVWIKTYDSPFQLRDGGSGCSIDTAGNIYVAGSTTNSSNMDFLIIKFNSDGDTLWTAKYNSPFNGDDIAHDCDLDNQNNMYVNGYSFNGSSYNMLLIKYDLNGDTLWTRRSAQSVADIGTKFTGCSVYQSECVYVTGTFENTQSDKYSATTKYDANGDLNWTMFYDTSTNDDHTFKCVTDVLGDVYLVGLTYYTPNLSDDWLILKLNSDNGNLLWLTTYGISNFVDIAINCDMDDSGRLYVCGVANFGNNSNFHTRVYESTVTQVEKNKNKNPHNFKLQQNYPNPFNPVTRIRFSIPNPQIVTIKVYDVLGNEIGTLLNELRSFGDHEIDFDGSKLPTGVYFYKIVTESFSDTRKMVLFR